MREVDLAKTYQSISNGKPSAYTVRATTLNLHGIVSGAIGAVNPHTSATLKVSTGTHSRRRIAHTPTFTTVTGLAQVQAMTYKDLTQVSGLNINGNAVAVYLYGAFSGVVRNAQKGGDILTIAAARCRKLA